MIPWVTVETLTPPVMSVATIGDAARGFANLQRVVQRLLAKQPGIRDAITTQGLIDIIETTRRHRQEVDHEIATRSRRYRLVSRPVLGPGGDVYAVRFWLGPIGAVPAQRPACGLIWDRNTQTIRASQTDSADRSHAAVTPHCALSIAEVFHQARDFDHHEEVLETLYNPKAGGRLQFDLTTAHDSGRTTRWRNTIRIAEDPTRLARWLAEDITSDSAPPTGTSLEQRGLKEAVRRSAKHIAVVELAHTSISHWLTDPAPWIRWARLSRPADAFHPDDRHELAHAANRIQAGDSAEVTLRTLNHRGGYTLTNLLLYPFPGRSSRRVAIGELTLAAPRETTSGTRLHTNDQ